MKRTLYANELVGMQISTGSSDYEILSFDRSYDRFLVNELEWDDENSVMVKTSATYYLTTNEVKRGLHNMDGINHTILFAEEE